MKNIINQLLKPIIFIVLLLIILTVFFGCKEWTPLEECKDELIKSKATTLKQKIKIERLQLNNSVHSGEKEELDEALDEISENNTKIRSLMIRNALLIALIEHFDPACFEF